MRTTAVAATGLIMPLRNSTIHAQSIVKEPWNAESTVRGERACGPAVLVKTQQIYILEKKKRSF